MGHRHTVRGGVDTFLGRSVPVRLVVVRMSAVVDIGSALAVVDGAACTLAVAVGSRDVGSVSGHDECGSQERAVETDLSDLQVIYIFCQTASMVADRMPLIAAQSEFLRWMNL